MTTSPENPMSMKRAGGIATLLIMMVQGVLFASPARAQSSPLDLTALVGDVKETKPNPCVSADASGEEHAKYFGLKPNKSRFKLVNHQALVYRIDVKSLLSKEIEKARF